MILVKKYTRGDGTPGLQAVDSAWGQPEGEGWVEFPDATSIEEVGMDENGEPVVRNVTAPVPQQVSRFQARAALLEAGHLDDVEALINDPATPALTKLAWQDAQVFERVSPAIASIAQAMGWDDATVDQLFIDAAEITA